MKKLIFLCLFAVFSVNAQSLDSLLNKVKAEQKSSRQAEAEREKNFSGSVQQWQQKLAQAQARLAAAKQTSTQLSERFDNNEKQLAELDADLSLATENLGELFGVVRQVSREFGGGLETSVISAQYPDRINFVNELAERKALPTLDELRQLWFLMQQEMTESAKVTRFTTQVLNPQGVAQQKEVLRLGGFNLVSDNQYLVMDENSKQLQHLTRPVPGNIQTSIDQWQPSSSQPQLFYFDPSKSDLLTMLARQPTLMERVHQGGVIGYLILSVLALGLVISLVRFMMLSKVSFSVARQLKNPVAQDNNPLGRILSVYQSNKKQQTQVLELKLDEAIIREAPKLEKGIGILKILAAIAPMMGLLGTVTGMIGTFQSITMFGTGDPKLMAGGISMALITTVMGLVAALPLLLIHSLLHSRAQSLVNLLEQQSAGMVAEQAEAEARQQAQALTRSILPDNEARALTGSNMANSKEQDGSKLVVEQVETAPEQGVTGLDMANSKEKDELAV